MAVPLLPEPLPGFESVRRHWSPEHQISVAVIEPGEFYVSLHSEGIMTTLGSCIAACVRDPVAKIGGMNHFMLPLRGNVHRDTMSRDATLYGNWAMEYLINELLKQGAKRRFLEVKLFGGGEQQRQGEGGVSNTNVAFALDYVRDENLQLISQDLGGIGARQILYFPMTGKVLMKKMQQTDHIVSQEARYGRSLDQKSSGAGSDRAPNVELF